MAYHTTSGIHYRLPYIRITVVVPPEAHHTQGISSRGSGDGSTPLLVSSRRRRRLGLLQEGDDVDVRATISTSTYLRIL